jgi:exonuclease SbcC
MIRPKSAISINSSRNIFHKKKSRPNSGNYKYPILSTSQNIKNNPYVVIYSMPNNPKISKGMGKTIQKEELYENSIQLKISINKIKKELDEAKSIIFQKDMELKKKNKIIEDCIRENDIEEIHKENIEKGKESTLLSLCKEKYYEMKKAYKKKCEENDILKANIKITKIKEIQIECDVLKNELDKMKNLYLNSQEQVQLTNQKMNNLQIFKNKFLQQHLLINSLQKNCDELNISNKQLKQEISKMNNNLEKKEKERKKLKIVNSKLKVNNERFLNEKKSFEYKKMQSNDNFKKIIELQKQLSEYKRLYDQKCKEIQNLNKNISPKKIENNLTLKPINYSTIKDIRVNERTENEKISLLKNLLKDSQIKNKIYENFLIQNDCEINKILEDGGYNNGVINTNSANLIRSFSNPNNHTTNNYNNSLNNNTNYYSTNNINQVGITTNNNVPNTNSTIKYVDNINDVIEKENQTENQEIKENQDIQNQEIQNQDIQNQDIQNQVIEENQGTQINEDEDLFKSLDFIILKNLESNHVKKENLYEEVNQIYKTFEENTKTDAEISRDDFIRPFTELFVNNMKITNQEDILIINNYLGKIIDGIEDNIDKFFEHLSLIFDNIIDYTQVNENELLLNIKNALEQYPDIVKELKEKDINNNYIITILTFKKITDKLKVELNDDLMEFLIYKMKISVPEGYSMLDLNYSIIEELMNYELNESNNIEIISNLFQQLKISLNEKNEDFNNILSEKIVNINFDNMEIQAIKKDDFFEIFKDNGIGIGENEQNDLYDNFKLQNEINENDNLMNVSRIKEFYESD